MRTSTQSNQSGFARSTLAKQGCSRPFGPSATARALTIDFGVLDAPLARRQAGECPLIARARPAPPILRTSPRKKEGGLTQGRIDRNLSFVRGTTAKKTTNNVVPQCDFILTSTSLHPVSPLADSRRCGSPPETQGPIPGGKEARVEFGLFSSGSLRLRRWFRSRSATRSGPRFHMDVKIGPDRGWPTNPPR